MLPAGRGTVSVGRLQWATRSTNHIRLYSYVLSVMLQGLEGQGTKLVHDAADVELQMLEVEGYGPFK